MRRLLPPCLVLPVLFWVVISWIVGVWSWWVLLICVLPGLYVWFMFVDLERNNPWG